MNNILGKTQEYDKEDCKFLYDSFIPNTEIFQFFGKKRIKTRLMPEVKVNKSEYEKLVKKRLTLSQIADKLKIERYVLDYWVKKEYNFPRKVHVKIEKEEVLTLRENGKTWKEVAQIIGVDLKTLWKFRKSNGIFVNERKPKSKGKKI